MPSKHAFEYQMRSFFAQRVRHQTGIGFDKRFPGLLSEDKREQRAAIQACAKEQSWFNAPEGGRHVCWMGRWIIYYREPDMFMPMGATCVN